MPTQGFTVTVDGTEADIERVEIQGANVVLDLDMADYVEHGDTVKVSYAPPAAGFIQDALGNKLGAIAADDVEVSNPIPDPNETDPPDVSGVSVTDDGTMVRVTFDEPVFFSTFPPGLPVMVKLSAATDSQLTISWVAPTPMETVSGEAAWYEYRYRARPTGAWSGWNRTVSLSATVTGLPEDSAYQFQVRAGNVGGVSGNVQLTVRTAESIPTIPAPIVSRLSTQIIITWNTPDLTGAGINPVAIRIEIFRNNAWVVLTTPSSGGQYFTSHDFLTFIVLQFADNAIPNTGAFRIRVQFLDNSNTAVSTQRVIDIPA